MSSVDEETILAVEHISETETIGDQIVEIPASSSPEEILQTEDSAPGNDELQHKTQPLIHQDNGVLYSHEEKHIIEQPVSHEIINDLEHPQGPGPSHDADPNVLLLEPGQIMITPEDFYEAGFESVDLETLTEDQLAILVDVHEKRIARQNAEGQEVTIVTADECVQDEALLHPVVDERQQDLAVNPEESLTIMITDDGGLKLSDASGQTCYFTAEQLSEMEVDINNLTDESIQHVVQLAMPAISGKPQSDKPLNDLSGFHEMVEEQNLPSSSSGILSLTPLVNQRGRHLQMGEEVHIRTAEGEEIPVVVRYVRSPGTYKVQLSDGSFQWVQTNQILVRRKPTDHESYTSQTHRPYVQHHVTNRQMSTNLKRHAPSLSHSTSHDLPVVYDDLQPPYLKRASNEPNFCCPICDKNVYQKEPAFIVIRLPACDTCTKEKIIVLDEQH